jgi:AcrR family transcriptional regulator
MIEIAAALNLRDATLYYYFPSKSALAYACHLRSLERFEALLQDAEKAGGTGAAKIRHLVLGLLTDSAHNGSQIYFGDHSYLDADQREHILEWAGRLTAMTEQHLKDGIADGSLVPCETQLVVQLLLGMLIWLARWVPKIDGMTVERLMSAIGAFSLDGLETAKGRNPKVPAPAA